LLRKNARFAKKRTFIYTPHQRRKDTKKNEANQKRKGEACENLLKKWALFVK